VGLVSLPRVLWHLKGTFTLVCLNKLVILLMCGEMKVRRITNLFKHTNVKVPFRCHNNLYRNFDKWNVTFTFYGKKMFNEVWNLTFEGPYLLIYTWEIQFHCLDSYIQGVSQLVDISATNVFFVTSFLWISHLLINSQFWKSKVDNNCHTFTNQLSLNHL